MPAVSADLGLLPDPDLVRPRIWIGTSAVAEIQFYDEARREVAVTEEVTFLWRSPFNIVVELAGVAVAGKPGLFRCSYQAPVAGFGWAVRARKGSDAPILDWALFDVVAEPAGGPVPQQSLWLTGPTTAAVSLQGTHLTGATIPDFPTKTAFEPDDLIPAVASGGESVNVTGQAVVDAATAAGAASGAPAVAAAIAVQVPAAVTAQVPPAVTTEVAAKVAPAVSEAVTATLPSIRTDAASAATAAIAPQVQQVVTNTETVVAKAGEVETKRAQVANDAAASAANSTSSNAAAILSQNAATAAIGSNNGVAGDPAHDAMTLKDPLGYWYWRYNITTGKMENLFWSMGPNSEPGVSFKDDAGFVFLKVNAKGFQVRGLTVDPAGNAVIDGTLTAAGSAVATQGTVDAGDAATLSSARTYTDQQIAASGGGGGGTVTAVPSRSLTQFVPRAGVASNTPSTAGVANDFNMWLPLTASDQAEGWTDIVIVDGNFGQNSLAFDGPNDFTSRYAIEYPIGSPPIPLIWENGLRDMTVQPGALARTYPLPIVIPGGASFRLRQYLTVPAGGTWVSSFERLTVAEQGAVEFGTGTDKTLTGTVPTVSATTYAPRTPVSILARPTSALVPSGPRAGKGVAGIFITGDSISEGTGDGNTAAYRAYPARGIAAANFGFSRASRSGNRFTHWDTPSEQYRRLYGSQGCTHAFCNYGTNDLTVGATFSSLQASATLLNSMFRQRGMKLILATLTPRTNATNDGFYDTDTQTTVDTLLAYNDWLRTKPFGNPIFDAASFAANPQNPRFWRTDLGATPPDGLHPTEALHAAIGAGLTAAAPTLFI
ncbi:SGNH/GDSL hydrolase family protein [Pararoseomonas indoligenes]|uniref:SGNH/GDSL hydrolase family protein n=1 Tax=Roseomonas indoligenes TaxID=2820811 RepID=A0A940S4N3_9PROT|nr:SGNH/GDSL hydrolase family protein [Pararoseomonas indoligenes]MBP0492145.1 SGNH/GDSL hydrolase family protein [Pararoseomonas indoligenes]